MSNAILWRQQKKGRVQCVACSHFCLIEPGDRGICGVRENRNGEMHSLVRNKIAALNLDPIEKKPLFHFLPGSQSLSLGTMGCNLSCSFCQNHSLSQPPRHNKPVEGESITPEKIISIATQYRAASISYTYTEPTVFIELVMDIARPAKEKGLKNIIVSNGFQSPDCLSEMNGYIDAANIDLKSFSEKFHQDFCGAKLKPVLDNLVRIREMGWWLEVTTLIIPGLNDSREELRKIAGFIFRELGPDTPWHISRFHPTFRMTDIHSTPVATLESAYATGLEQGLRFVYTGNVPGHDAENTFCPACKKQVINRMGFSVRHSHVKDMACSFCGEKIAGLWR